MKLQITRQSIARTQATTNWDIQAHVDDVYERFRFRRGKAPPLDTEALRSRLMQWKADLGARAGTQMDWAGFMLHHRAILQPLSTLPRLGRLTDNEVELVTSVVLHLESFKDTTGRMLVFGSKAAHFHFPGLVPIMSSEVRDGLKELARAKANALKCYLPAHQQEFRFGSARQNLNSYRNYVALGNALCADLDAKKLLQRTSATFDLHAKLFEWWTASQRPSDEE